MTYKCRANSKPHNAPMKRSSQILKCHRSSSPRRYFEKYFRPDMLNGDIIPGYAVPSSNKHADYVSLIASLPDSDGPEIFGLPANIERAKQRMSSGLIINKLQSLGAAGGSGGEFDARIRRICVVSYSPSIHSALYCNCTVIYQNGYHLTIKSCFTVI